MKPGLQGGGNTTIKESSEVSPLLRLLIRITDYAAQSESLGFRCMYKASFSLLSSLFADTDFTDLNGNRFLLHPQDVIDRRLLATGLWEPYVTACMREQIKPGQVFYDVGANIGYHSLLAARLVGPEGRVIAFEPNPAIAARFRHHIQLNDIHNVDVIEACVTTEPTRRVTLHLPPRNIPNPGRATTRAEPGFHAIECDAVRVDELVQRGAIPRPDIIKVDVEGAEIIVLQSMSDTFSETHRKLTVLLEVTEIDGEPSDAVLCLQKLGFRTAAKSPPYRFHRRGIPYEQRDAVFVREAAGTQLQPRL